MPIAEQAAAQAESQLNSVKAQADLERAKKQGLTFNFTGEQLAQYPGLLQIAAQIQQAWNGIQTQPQKPAIHPPPPQPEQVAPEMVPA